MKIGEDLFCFCYMLLSSIGFFHQLGNQPVVTVQCENSRTVCLEHVSHGASLRYSFTAKELEFRCNTEGISFWLRLLVFFGVFYEFVVYGGAIYIYYYKPKTVNVDLGIIVQRCVYVKASITGAFTGFTLLLPLAIYVTPNGGAGRRGVLAEIWASPTSGLLLFIMGILTAPLKWIVHNRFKTELGLNEIHANYTCVEPSIENGSLKCPMEANWFPNMPDPSICESDFYCTQQCLVVFPTIVINSLGFILASLALFYRLLILTHYIIERERGFDSQNTEDGSSATVVEEWTKSQDNNSIESVSSGISGCDMKDKPVGRSKPKAAGLKTNEKAVYPRRNAIGKREATQESAGQGSERGNATLDSQKRDTNKSNDPTSVTANSCDITVQEVDLDRFKEIAKNNSELPRPNEAHLNRFREKATKRSEQHKLEANFDGLSERNSLVNGKSTEERTQCLEEQNIAPKTNTEIEKSGSKILTTSKKHQATLTEETSYRKKNGKTLTGCGNQSNKTKNSQGKPKRTSTPNGHLKEETKVHRQTEKVQNGFTEVKVGNYNGGEGPEEPEWSSSEDIVDGIEGILVVEDESEFYMSGFRL